MTEEDKNPVGRPPISKEDKEVMLSKLEPYLKSGLSIRKSLLEAGVPSATFYRVKDTDDEFREKIDRFRQFVSVLLNNSIVREIQAVIKKQNNDERLTGEEVSLLKWFATNSNLTKGEFGERKNIGLYDPEAEISRLSKLMDDPKDAEKKE